MYWEQSRTSRKEAACPPSSPERLPAPCHGCFPVIRRAGCAAAEISTQTSQLLFGDITADLPAHFKIPTFTLARKQDTQKAPAPLSNALFFTEIKESSRLFQSHVLLFFKMSAKSSKYTSQPMTVLHLLAPMTWSEGHGTLTITKNSVMVTV